MNSHLDNLLEIIPNMFNYKILDIGSGKGCFLIDASKKGSDVYGLELSGEYISISIKEAERQNVKINVTQGFAEELPFADDFFNFLNLSEVIEHVKDPLKVFNEMKRVLKKEGFVYISVPSRYSIFDTHFHLFFINWLPRKIAHNVIGILGKHKNYNSNNGKQRIDRMYYSTFGSIKKVLEDKGFEVKDIRELKINRKIKNIFLRKIALFIYRVVRNFWFRAHHLLLILKNK